MVHRKHLGAALLLMLFLIRSAPPMGAGEKEPAQLPSLSALMAQERYAEAFEAAEAQLKADPDDKELALTRARCLFMVGRYGEALEAAQTLSKAGPERMDVQDFRADCLFASFRPLEAVQVWKPLLEEKRWFGAALKKSAMALMAAGDDEGARKLLETRLPLPPAAPDDLLLLSLRVFDGGKPRVAALEELARRHPDNADYQAELGVSKALGDRPMAQILAPKSLPFKIPMKWVHGEPTLDATLEGKRAVRLAFDTGNQRMLLNRESARKLNLTPLASTLRKGLGGAAPEAVSTVLLSSLSLGGLEVRNLIAHINARDWEFWQKKAGYIGFFPFRSFVSLYDLMGHFLEIRPAGTSPQVLLDAPDARSQPILWSSGLPMVPVTVNGRTGLPFLLDTGAPNTLMDKTLAARMGIRASLRKYSSRTGLGHSGAFSYDVAEKVIVEFAGMRGSRVLLQLDGEPVPDNIVFIAEIPQRFAVPCFGVLGRDFLNNFRVVFDGPGGTVTLAPYPRH